MNSYLRIVLLGAFSFVPNAVVAAQDSSLQQTIIAKEREEPEAIKSGDMTRFAELLADDAVFLNQRGHGDKALVVKNTSLVRLLDFSMDDIHFVPLGGKFWARGISVDRNYGSRGQAIQLPGVCFGSVDPARR